MEREKTEAAIEAILFAMGNAVSVDKIAAAIVNKPPKSENLKPSSGSVTTPALG